MSGYQRISTNASTTAGGNGSETQTQVLDGEDGCVCSPFLTNIYKLTVYRFLNIILIGVPWLVMRWFSHWKVPCTCNPSAFNEADTILITDENNEKTVCRVKIEYVDFIPDEFASRSTGVRQLQHQNSRTRLFDAENSGSVYRYFIYREQKYVWDDGQNAFRKIEGLHDLSCQRIFEDFRGICTNRRIQLKTIYGANEISVEVKSYLKLLVDEVLNPFYLFQIFSVLLWCFDEYYYYAACVVIISGVSIVISLYKTRKQSITLREMASGSGDLMVSVRRPDGEEEEIFSRDLVPGDVLLVPPEGFIMPCDAVLIQGKCIVNESMLTGESVPVNKSALLPSNDNFNCESHKKHVVFCGTQLIQPRFYAGNKVACVVVRTGYSTLKGQLIRSILYPKEVGFKFYTDSMKFVFLLFCTALIGMVYCIYLYIERGSTWYVLMVRVLDIVTIVVPPALPAAMTVGTLNAQSRLKNKQIFCISPQRINFCGKLKVICFDKTGTLTEEGLNLSCVVPTATNDTDGVEDFMEPVSDPQQLPTTSHLLKGMATCHSLTYIKGSIVGDPLDLKMFESTGWVLEEPSVTGNDTARYDLLPPNVVKKDDTEIGIIREFDFTPQLQRMSVVVNCLEPREMVVYCKGAPEKIRPLCDSVPNNFDKILDWFTVKGFRVLALSWKRLEKISWLQIQKINREKIESNLRFAGFLIMQNSLKPATIPVIRDLTSAKIRKVMVTGDHMLTALSVARECGMIPKQDKVVIVNVNDSGSLEYTLASNHYEANESDHGENSRLVINNERNGNDTELSISVERVVEEVETEARKFTRRLSKRFSFDSNNPGPDTVIDMERLIPIGSEVLNGSDYHFALTGRTWTFLQQNTSGIELQKIVAKGAVFARMSPECKMQLVESLQELGYIVAMCGDGANDCSALSMAHVGISLSEAEASVAAPFTSKVADISCVPKLILEGRCALVTSFGIFKYMALYSMVQFASVLILYTHMTNLADTQFLWIDLAITMTITVAMGRTEPVRRLVSKRPMSSLVSFSNVFSIFSQISICVGIQLCAMEVLKTQEWFHPVKPSSGDELKLLCWETTTIFSISSFQYLIMSVVFSKGKPFRKPFYLNYGLLLATVLLTSATAVLMIYPFSYLATFFTLEPVSPVTQHFRLLLISFPVINLILSSVTENYLVGSKLLKRFGKSFWKSGPKSQYKVVLQTLEEDNTWPPVKASFS